MSVQEVDVGLVQSVMQVIGIGMLVLHDDGIALKEVHVSLNDICNLL